MLNIKKIIFTILFCLNILDITVAVHASEEVQAGTYKEQMLSAMQRGDYNQAILSGIEAEKLYSKNENVSEQINVRIQLSTAYQNLGHYKKGLEHLIVALNLDQKVENDILKASILGRLGNAYVLINELEEGESYLNKSLELTDKVNNPEVRASTLNYLGNLYVLRRKYDEALKAYKEGIILSEKTNNQLLAARIKANAAKTSIWNGNYGDAENILRSAYEKHSELADSRDKVYGLINIAQAYRQLLSISSTFRADLESLSSKVLKEAAVSAENIDDHVSLSYSLGYLGQIFEDDKLYPDAITMTRQAIFHAQQANVPESLYLWQWQIGRLFKAEGKMNEAITSYRNAVHTLQTIRPELMGDCKIYNQLSFKESIEPVYFELIDLLLQRTDSIKDQNVQQSYYVDARQVTELLKNAELQDYFQDACISARKVKIKGLDTVSSNTAVIYLIPLHDRLEILLGLSKGIERFTSQVDLQTFTKEIRLFRRMLETEDSISGEYLRQAQTLYEYIIGPIEAELISQHIDTIVFVSHGPLRTIPLAALYNGKEFLINKYALATTPGLSVTDIQPPHRGGDKVLLAGLTQAVQGFPALVNVPMELKAIQELYSSVLLQDNDFQIQRVKKEIESSPYSIIHIASHGEFSDDSRKTYILTWDGKLAMDDLERFMKISKFHKDSLELLTLSACMTAAGDDRAALGLAGVAVKAGAKSAVATLWYINDLSSYELITEFYRQLQISNMSKAKALQIAQIKLLKNKKFQHPYYWSPFLLIGNWL